jgi:hypothetical protein
LPRFENSSKRVSVSISFTRNCRGISRSVVHDYNSLSAGGGEILSVRRSVSVRPLRETGDYDGNGGSMKVLNSWSVEPLKRSYFKLFNSPTL